MFGALLNGWSLVAALSMTPLSELRGAIITGVGIGLDPFAVYWVSILFNSLVFIPIFFGLKLFYKGFLSKIKFVSDTVEKTRSKTEAVVNKYGPFGLILFVGLPLPFSGVWTATIGAWILGMDWRKAFTSVIIGVLISATLVLSGTLGVIRIFG